VRDECRIGKGIGVEKAIYMGVFSPREIVWKQKGGYENVLSGRKELCRITGDRTTLRSSILRSQGKTKGFTGRLSGNVVALERLKQFQQKNAEKLVPPPPVWEKKRGKRRIHK